jgi:hypothetical protein
MKIIVTENQFGKIMGIKGVPSEVLIEQISATNEQNVLTIVQQKINELISDPKKEKALLDNINIQILKGKTTLILQIGEKKFPMELVKQGIYSVIIPAGQVFSFATIPISSFQSEIEKIPEYKALVEKHPEIKQQIQSGSVLSQLYTSKTDQGHFQLIIKKDLDDRKQEKLAIDVNRPYPLGEFFKQNKAIFKLPNNLFAILESGNLMADIISAPLKLNSPPEETYTAPLKVETMALADVFTFGDVNFKDDARVNQQIQTFIQQIKEYITKYGQPFVQHLINQKPTIYGYSSRDGDPNQEMVGEYKPCSGNKIRKDYDLCLSTERARVLSELLNKGLPELGGIFQYKGMGQTDKWGPGWTPERPTIPEQTAANRRYLLSPITPFVVKGSPQGVN